MIQFTSLGTAKIEVMSSGKQLASTRYITSGLCKERMKNPNFLI